MEKLLPLPWVCQNTPNWPLCCLISSNPARLSFTIGSIVTTKRSLDTKGFIPTDSGFPAHCTEQVNGWLFYQEVCGVGHSGTIQRGRYVFWIIRHRSLNIDPFKSLNAVQGTQCRSSFLKAQDKNVNDNRQPAWRDFDKILFYLLATRIHAHFVLTGHYRQKKTLHSLQQKGHKIQGAHAGNQ